MVRMFVGTTGVNALWKEVEVEVQFTFCYSPFVLRKVIRHGLRWLHVCRMVFLIFSLFLGIFSFSPHLCLLTVYSLSLTTCVCYYEVIGGYREAVKRRNSISQGTVYVHPLIMHIIVVWIGNIFDNNFEIENNFTKYLKDSCW